MVVSPIAGAMSDRVGARRIMVGGLGLQAVGLGWFALGATDPVSYATLVVPLIVAGIGISMALPTTANAALGAVAPADLGKASGTNTTLQRFGGAFGVAIVTAVFSAHGHIGTAASYDAGFRPALAAAAGLSLAGAVAALAIPVKRRRAAASAVLAVPAVSESR
jgi:MFS family permease